MQGIKDLMIGADADMSFCFKDCLGCPPCCPVLPEAFFLFIIVPYLDHYLPYLPTTLPTTYLPYLSLTVVQLQINNQTPPRPPPAIPIPIPPPIDLLSTLPTTLSLSPRAQAYHRISPHITKPLHTFRLFPPHTRTLTRNAANAVVPQTNTGQNTQTSVPSR